MSKNNKWIDFDLNATDIFATDNKFIWIRATILDENSAPEDCIGRISKKQFYDLLDQFFESKSGYYKRSGMGPGISWVSCDDFTDDKQTLQVYDPTVEIDTAQDVYKRVKVYRLKNIHFEMEHG